MIRRPVVCRLWTPRPEAGFSVRNGHARSCGGAAVHRPQREAGRRKRRRETYLAFENILRTKNPQGVDRALLDSLIVDSRSKSISLAYADIVRESSRTALQFNRDPVGGRDVRTHDDRRAAAALCDTDADPHQGRRPIDMLHDKGSGGGDGQRRGRLIEESTMNCSRNLDALDGASDKRAKVCDGVTQVI